MGSKRKKAPADYRVSRKRTFNAFAELRHANRVLLENARLKRDGWFYECMTSILLSAFSFEAYLNLAVPIDNSDARTKNDNATNAKSVLIHKKADANNKLTEKWLVKLKALLPPNNCSIDARDRDRIIQMATALFEFRNALAHAKNAVLETHYTPESGDIETVRRREPLTKWESDCTLEHATAMFEFVEQTCVRLHKVHNKNATELFQRSSGYVISEVNQQGHIAATRQINT